MATVACAGDNFCRCRACKPPLGPSQQFDPHQPRGVDRVAIGIIGIAIVLLLCALLGHG